MPDKENLKHDQDGLEYMRISELPEDEREPFTEALRGQTCPVIPGIEPQDAFYVWDYNVWKKHGKDVPYHLWD